MGDLPEVVDAINHVGHTAHEDSCASMYYVDLPTFAKGEELKYRPRLSKEELARKLRSLESIDADGERWERESEVIQVSGSSAAEVKRKLKELSRTCHGSRGRTPVTRLVWSILAVGVEPLHIFLNLCNVSVESTGTVLHTFGVLDLVKSVTPPAVVMLFDRESRDAAKSDHYADNGNVRQLLVLHMERMLEPVATRARKEKNSSLQRVYDQVWEFFRCLGSVLKAIMTLHAEGYAEQLERLERDVERWVQILLEMTPDLYNLRAYVELARYVVPAMARSVSTRCCRCVAIVSCTFLTVL